MALFRKKIFSCDHGRHLAARISDILMKTQDGDSIVENKFAEVSNLI